MPESTANTSIKLDVHKPKKDRTVAVGTQVVAATEVMVWARASVNTNLTQSIIGTFDVLFRYAKANLKGLSGATVLSVPIGGGVSQVTVNGAPAVTDCSLHIGATVIDKEQSHFLDRTCKRLREAWLEER